MPPPNPFPARAVADKDIRTKWVRAICPVPPPHPYKIETLQAYAQWARTKIFIETGTYKAETTTALAPHFSKVISIELDQTLASAAQRVFAHSKHVKIVQGDSGLVLPKILAEINERCLFWLDGHNCGPTTGMSKDFGPTPVMKELEVIFTHPVKDHIIIIDDHRYFTGEWGYPTMDSLVRYLQSVRPDFVIDVCMDSIRIHPEKV
jgi:hypothetical protein